MDNIVKVIYGPHGKIYVGKPSGNSKKPDIHRLVLQLLIEEERGKQKRIDGRE